MSIMSCRVVAVGYRIRRLVALFDGSILATAAAQPLASTAHFGSATKTHARGVRAAGRAACAAYLPARWSVRSTPSRQAATPRARSAWAMCIHRNASPRRWAPSSFASLTRSGRMILACSSRRNGHDSSVWPSVRRWSR
jgi:hypothetical protein